jgi:hypothetical protein
LSGNVRQPMCWRRWINHQASSLENAEEPTAFGNAHTFGLRGHGSDVIEHVSAAHVFIAGDASMMGSIRS